MSYTTYSNYYKDTDWTTSGYDTEAVLQLFGQLSGSNAVTGPQLFDEVKRTTEVNPHLYLYLVKDDPNLRVLHRGMYHPKPMGGVAAEWHDKLLMLGGDVVAEQLPQVHTMSTQMFTTAGTINAPTYPELMIQLELDANALIADMDRDAPESTYDTLTTRKGMFLPPELASHVLNRAIRPSGLLRIMHGLSKDDTTKQKAWKPLTDWLRIACMETGRALIERSSAASVPMLTPALVTYVKGKVQGDLPGWTLPITTPPATASPVTAETLTQLITTLASQQPTGTRLDSNSGERPKTTPSKYFSETFNELLNFTQVEEESRLPDIWTKLVRCDKHQRLTALNQAYREMARELRLTAPVATAAQVLILINLAFVSPDSERLDQGLQPFATVYQDQAVLARQQEANEVYGLMMEGSNVAVQDILDVKEVGRLALPLSDRQLRKTLETFAVILAVLLGPRAAIVRYFMDDIVYDFDKVSERLEHYGRTQDLIYARYLRWLQLQFHEYWNKTTRGLGARPPPFYRLHEVIKSWAWLPPPIPAQYLPKPAKSVPKSPTPPTPEETTPKKDEKEKKRNNVWVGAKDNEKDDDLLKLGKAVGKIAVVTAKATKSGLAIPTDAQGNQLCQSYALRGGCYTGCDRVAQHRALTPDEKKSVVAFVEAGQKD